MAIHVGIELSPVACRIVTIGAAINSEAETRVRSYAIVPPVGVEMSAQLASLRRQSVAVVVWGVRSDHRQVMVGQRGYEKMKAEAVRSAQQAGVDSDGMLIDIAPVPASRGATRRAVVLAMAASGDVAAAIRPLREAGLRIRSVVTPALALTSLFRMRRAFSVPDAIESYVALEQASTAIALVRDGALVASHELTWGFGGERREVRTRDEIATRLAEALTDFFSAAGVAPGSVRQVSICGGMPELRNMTLPLMERLDLEVDTLDSLFRIDPKHLPEPTDEFRDHIAELRLAWTVAAEWRAPINLLRLRRRQEARIAMARAAVVAGVAAGLGLGWRIQRSQWWQSTASPASTGPASKATAQVISPPRRTTPPSPAPAPSLPKPLASPNPAEAAKTPNAIAALPPPSVAPRAPASRAPEPSPRASVPAARPAESAPRANVPAPSVIGPVPRASTPGPRAAEPPPRANVPAPRAPEPRMTETARPQPVAPSVASSLPRATDPAAPRPTAPSTPRVPPPAPRVAPAVPSPAAPAPSALPAPRVITPPTRKITPPPTPDAQRPASPPGRQAVPSPPPLPFDAVLATILYSPDRKLAIIDNRIVGPGDEVRGARVVDITPSSVLLRDSQGRMRILALSSSAR